LPDLIGGNILLLFSVHGWINVIVILILFRELNRNNSVVYSRYGHGLPARPEDPFRQLPCTVLSASPSSQTQAGYEELKKELKRTP
jgi:hypothetical protein